MKKIIISAEVLNRALHRLNNAVNVKSILPALSNILCKVSTGRMELIATDLETTIHCICVCESAEEFEFLVQFQLLTKIVALNKSQPLSISLEKKGIRITTDNDVYDLKSNDKLENFPKLVELPVENSMNLDPKFIGWLSTALITVGKEESRPALMKILLELRKEEITIASSDGSFHMFSYTMNIPAPADDDLLIIPKVIKAIDGLENIKLSWNDKNYAFSSEDVTVIVNRPDIKFIDFRKVVPENFTSNLTISRHELIKALEKCNISSDFFKETVLTLKKSKTKVSFLSKDTEYGININVDVAGAYTGEVEAVKCSSEKMLKLMQQVEFDQIEVAIHDHTRPILFRSAEDPSYLGLLMTMHWKQA